MRRIFITILSLAVSLVFVVAYTFVVRIDLLLMGPEHRETMGFLRWPTTFPEEIHLALPTSVRFYTGWLDTYSLLISIFVYAVPLYFLFDFAYRRAFRLDREGAPLPVSLGAASLAAEVDQPKPSFINWIAVVAWVAVVIVYYFSFIGFYAFMSLPILFVLIGPPAALAGYAAHKTEQLRKVWAAAVILGSIAFAFAESILVSFVFGL